MGYTTTFTGQIEIDPPLILEEVAYLERFSETRRMDRDRGPYYVGGSGGSDIREHNSPDPSQPGLWCKWIPTDMGRALEWSGAEKFYASEEWMRYLIDHFLRPNAIAADPDSWDDWPNGWDSFGQYFTFDHHLNGTIDAQGDDPEDRWKLVVEDNEVFSRHAKIVWE